MLAPTVGKPCAVPAGSGPRMVAYHPRLPMAALVNELARATCWCSGIDGKAGRHWRIVEQLSLPQAPSGDALAAHIAFPPDGGNCTRSVRGSDQLVVFPVDGQTYCRALRRCVRREGAAALFAVARRALSAVANLASDDVRLFERGCRRDAASGRVRGRHNRRASSERRPRAAANNGLTKTRKNTSRFQRTCDCVGRMWQKITDWARHRPISRMLDQGFPVIRLLRSHEAPLICA